MQQFVVPQFIEVEDKIIGPISTRQFIVMLAGGLLIVAEYKLADFSLFAFLGLLTLGLVIIFAFIKINGQPFHYFLLNFIQTLRRPRLKVWNKQLTVQEIKELTRVDNKESVDVKVRLPHKKSFTTSHLAELSLIVDTGGVYKGEE